jgi:uncharacterized protein YbaR (Trm112 family)
MKRELIHILACPICKAQLELSVEEENDKEIATGSLCCKKCGVHYLNEILFPIFCHQASVLSRAYGLPCSLEIPIPLGTIVKQERQTLADGRL